MCPYFLKKTVNGQTTIFHYNQNGLLIAESTSAGTITAEYAYLNGQPLAKIENNNVYYYHNDHLATPQKMTDNSGTVVWSADYKPFGEPLTMTGTVTNNLRFPGQYYDSETGLHQNWHRDYKSDIGRYIETDPIGIQKGKNHLFVYAGNNPENGIDPKGLAVYGGGEAHFIVGCGIETFVCCNGSKQILKAYMKVCLGAAFGGSITVGGVGNVRPRNCPDIFKGPSMEAGGGPVEGGVTIAPGLPFSIGSGFGTGFKFTPCWYIPIWEKELGCCNN